MLGPPEKSDSTGDERSGARALLDAMSNDQLHLARFILDAADGCLINAERGAHIPLAAAALLPEPAARARYLQLLLERGALVNAQDAWGRTALSHACELGYLDAVRRLVQAGADPELPDTWGNTALHYAAVAGHAPTVAFLVRAFKRLGGLDVHRTNRAGNSVLRLALALGHEECVRVLNGGKEGPGLASRGHPAEEYGEGGPKAELGAAIPHRCVLPRLQSMQSIEEEEWDSSEHLPSPRPPRTRSWSLQYTGGKTHGPFPPLPGLPPMCTSSLNLSCSPRAGRALPALPGHLSVLLTPLPPTSPKVTHSTHSPNRGTHGFSYSYYQKRSSLPSACLLNQPSTTECGLGPSTEPSPSPQTPGALALLSNKLFRRFTFPEFKKPGQASPVHNCQSGDHPEAGQSGLARSETFPLCKDHPKVASKSSIDSISAVKCEFDFASHS